nr:hypothetical protein Itr_chr02CG12130 [Ipomoea trifida]
MGLGQFNSSPGPAVVDGRLGLGQYNPFPVPATIFFFFGFRRVGSGGIRIL